MAEGRTILHIDDNPDCLETVRAILEFEGYSVVNAQSAADGLKAFEECSPALVIVDLMMEEVDSGARLAQDLRARAKGVPIYMLSGAGDSLSEGLDTAQLGLSGVLQKPIEPEKLIALVKARLS